jgi:hypothetical protein
MALAQALMMGYKVPTLDSLSYVATETVHNTSASGSVTIGIPSSAQLNDLLMIEGVIRSTFPSVTVVDSNSNAATVYETAQQINPNACYSYLLYDGSATSVTVTFGGSSNTNAGRCTAFRPSAPISNISVSSTSESSVSAISLSLSGLSNVPSNGMRLNWAAGSGRPDSTYNDCTLSISAGASGWTVVNNSGEPNYAYLIESGGTVYTNTTAEVDDGGIRNTLSLAALDLT